MSQSTLDLIYTILDGMAVTYTNAQSASVTATCYTLSETPDSVQTAHLPCRILMLPQTQMTLGPGPEANATYTIRELFLLETVGRTEGTRINTPVLVRYQQAYQDAIAKKWQLVNGWQTEALTLSAQFAPGKYAYPSDSDTVFYGTMVTLTIEEIF